MNTRLFYNSDTERPYVGFQLPADQLAALDVARLKLRQSRSEFARQAIAAYLQQIKAAATS